MFDATTKTIQNWPKQTGRGVGFSVAGLCGSGDVIRPCNSGDKGVVSMHLETQGCALGTLTRGCDIHGCM